MIKRALVKRLIEDSAVFRILNIKGARQAGKTTLVKQLINEGNFTYFNFDKKQDYEFAQTMPNEFVQQAETTTMIIDEIQKMPEILPYLKMQVDESNKPGQFIITGSADILKMKNVYESLAGRKVDYELMTFSLAELYNLDFNILDLLVKGEMDSLGHYFEDRNEEIFHHAIKGGYPEVQNLTFRQRKNWFRSYITSRIIKDMDDITDGTLQKLDLLPKMLKYLAWQAGDLLNYSSVAGELSIDIKTVKNYLHFLDTLFLTKVLPPYFVNVGKRQVKTPKFYFSDSGMLSYFLNVEKLPDMKFTGKIMESFIYNELLKNSTVSDENIDFFFYRDKSQYEVDLILEKSFGELIAVEIKAKENLTDADMKGIRKVRRLFGEKLTSAYVFYGGKLMYPVKTDTDVSILAVPFSALLGKNSKLITF